jgi:hypothetical protein
MPKDIILSNKTNNLNTKNKDFTAFESGIDATVAMRI